MKKAWFFGLMVLGVSIYILAISLSQPGVDDLSGDFEEKAFYRNENNTGPVVRIYAVSVEDTLWSEMKKFGELMPHNKYGTTKVYFFRKSAPVPQQVFPGEENFDPAFKEFCLARYEKNAMGSVDFVIY